MKLCFVNVTGMTRGRLTQVAVTLATPSAGTGILLLGSTSGGVTEVARTGLATAGLTGALPAMIGPAGWFYRVNTASGTVSINNWWEIRA